MQRSPHISLEIIPLVFSVLSGSFLPLLQRVDPDIKQMDVQLLQDSMHLLSLSLSLACLIPVLCKLVVLDFCP